MPHLLNYNLTIRILHLQKIWINNASSDRIETLYLVSCTPLEEVSYKWIDLSNKGIDHDMLDKLVRHDYNMPKPFDMELTEHKVHGRSTLMGQHLHHMYITRYILDRPAKSNKSSIYSNRIINRKITYPLTLTFSNILIWLILSLNDTISLKYKNLFSISFQSK